MKKIKSLLVAATFLLSPFAAMAACGDSMCGVDQDGEFLCVVETPDGGTEVCTSSNPCSINCS